MESKETNLKGASMSEIDRRNMLVGISGASAGIGYLIPATAKAEEKLTGWQPIETAPKDGTLVILLVPERNHKVHIGKWHDSATYEFGKKTYEHKYWDISDV